MRYLRHCAYCEYNDRCDYTSFPPEYKCAIEAKEEHEYVRRRFFELEEKVERLYRIVEELRLGLAERKES